MITVIFLLGYVFNLNTNLLPLICLFFILFMVFSDEHNIFFSYDKIHSIFYILLLTLGYDFYTMKCIGEMCTVAWILVIIDNM